jgi:GNAT superfamily N-acetyltransferase
MNDARVTYRDMAAGEGATVSGLVRRVFDEFVAPQFSPQGIDEFLSYIEPNGFAQRIAAGHIVILAVDADVPVGMVEIRDRARISLLFVDEAQQGKGIGRGLVSRAFRRCAAGAEGCALVTVHASPNSVGFYQKVGFRAEGFERTENGIRYVPMRVELRR